MATDLITATEEVSELATAKVSRRAEDARAPRIPGSPNLAVPVMEPRRNTLFSEALLEMSSTRPHGARQTYLCRSCFTPSF
jgi:hypothetical protein